MAGGGCSVEAMHVALLVLPVVSRIVFSAPIAEKVPSSLHEAVLALQAGYFEGDIVNTPEEYIQGRATHDFLWPGGEVPYIIHKDLKDHIPMIKYAMSLMGNSFAVKFVPRDKQRDFIHIQSLKGCYSYVGRQGNEQPVSLGKGCWNIGTMLHEFMHVVGFYHEHSRPDRDRYIDVFLDNVEPGYEKQFAKLDLPWNRLITPFDYDSVMLYGSSAFAIDKDSPTMLKKNGGKLEEVYKKKRLSSMDSVRLDRLYKSDW